MVAAGSEEASTERRCQATRWRRFAAISDQTSDRRYVSLAGTYVYLPKRERERMNASTLTDSAADSFVDRRSAARDCPSAQSRSPANGYPERRRQALTRHG